MKRFRFLTRDAIQTARDPFREYPMRLLRLLRKHSWKLSRDSSSPVHPVARWIHSASEANKVDRSFADRVETRPKEVERSSPPLITAVHPRHSSRFPSARPHIDLSVDKRSADVRRELARDRGRSIRGQKRFLSRGLPVPGIVMINSW